MVADFSESPRRGSGRDQRAREDGQQEGKADHPGLGELLQVEVVDHMRAVDDQLRILEAGPAAGCS